MACNAGLETFQPTPQHALKAVMTMATIKDIAQQAGVSVSCVSRALNNYPDISQETRQRVLTIVEALHYYPKASARQMVTHHTQTIGLVFNTHDQSGLTHPYIARVLTSFSNAVGAQGYDLLLFSNMQAPFDRWGLAERVQHREVEGVFMIGPPSDVEAVLDTQVPAVGLDFTWPGTAMASVMSENRRAMYELVRHLYTQGYRRFGFAHGPLTMLPAMERLQRFYSGLWEVGIAASPEWIFDDHFTYEGGCAVATQLLRLKARPEVVLFSSDMAAIGAMQTFQEGGLQIPAEISVTGFDDVFAATIVYPELTTVRQPMEALGHAAAQLLLQLMRGPGTLPQHLTLPTEIIVRQSTRAINAPTAGSEHDRPG